MVVSCFFCIFTPLPEKRWPKLTNIFQPPTRFTRYSCWVSACDRLLVVELVIGQPATWQRQMCPKIASGVVFVALVVGLQVIVSAIMCKSIVDVMILILTVFLLYKYMTRCFWLGFHKVIFPCHRTHDNPPGMNAIRGMVLGGKGVVGITVGDATKKGHRIHFDIFESLGRYEISLQ